MFALFFFFFFFQAEDGIRDGRVTGVQTCALPILRPLLFGAALLLPVLAALGFLAMGRELAILGANRAWLEAHVSLMNADQRIRLAYIRDGLLAVYFGAIGLVLAARELRSLLERNRRPLITISYP